MTDGLRVAADIGGTFTDIAFITRDGVVARHQTLHRRAVHRPGIASLRDEDPRC